jgi:hypothetical protein
LVIGLGSILMANRAPISEDGYSFLDYRPLRIVSVNDMVAEESIGVATVISDVSLRFIHVSELPPGTRVSVDLDLPDANVALDAVVTSCRARVAAGQDPFFQVELKYMHVSEASRRELIRYFFEDATPRAFSMTQNSVQKEKAARGRGKELRKQPRTEALIPIYLTHGGGEKEFGVLTDLSPKGARLKLPLELKPGSNVLVQIPWLRGALKAKVVRCIKESGQINPPCDIGLQFLTELNLTPNQMKMIQVLRSNASSLVPAA